MWPFPQSGPQGVKCKLEIPPCPRAQLRVAGPVAHSEWLQQQPEADGAECPAAQAVWSHGEWARSFIQIHHPTSLQKPLALCSLTGESGRWSKFNLVSSFCHFHRASCCLSELIAFSVWQPVWPTEDSTSISVSDREILNLKLPFTAGLRRQQRQAEQSSDRQSSDRQGSDRQGSDRQGRAAA